MCGKSRVTATAESGGLLKAKILWAGCGSKVLRARGESWGKGDLTARARPDKASPWVVAERRALIRPSRFFLLLQAAVKVSLTGAEGGARPLLWWQRYTFPGRGIAAAPLRTGAEGIPNVATRKQLRLRSQFNNHLF